MGRILLADDKREFRTPVAAVLQNQGHQVACAEDGQQALALLATECPDLIVLDLAMPGMDGTTFLERIRREPKWQALPVIVMTATTVEGVHARLRNLGVIAILVKTHFSLSEIVAAVTCHLQPAEPPRKQC
jgi:CheY-like chemotaxis protein